MASVDDVTVRRATAEDHCAIVRNGDVYWGKDYLPTIFPQVVNDPEVYPVVAELKGQVVGFMMDHVVDGGTSVIRRAVRTFPSYRNMGVMQKMSNILNSLTEESYPSIRFRYQATGISERKLAADDLHSKGFIEILRKPVINLVYRAAEINGLDARDGLPDVLALEYDDVKTLFTLEDQLEQLFPSKRLFNFYIGYRCLESNIKHVLNENKEVCVTTKTASHTTNTKSLSVLQDVDMVTFSYWYMAEAGLVYAIDIYAKEDHNKASLQAHILRHLRVLKELNLCDRGVLSVSLGRNVSDERVRLHLSSCGIVDPLPNSENWKVLLEKKI